MHRGQGLAQTGRLVVVVWPCKAQEDFQTRIAPVSPILFQGLLELLFNGACADLPSLTE